MVPPPAPIVRSRKLSKSTNAVSFANAPTREVDGKDAIIRHLRSDNERLEKLVVEAVNASEEVATKAVEEQVGGLEGWRAGGLVWRLTTSCGCDDSKSKSTSCVLRTSGCSTKSMRSKLSSPTSGATFGSRYGYGWPCRAHGGPHSGMAWRVCAAAW